MLSRLLDPDAHGSERWLRLSALIVVVISLLSALPAFLVPLGLPVEGDAVDYRIPIVRWILRHGAYPNWPWTMVDDYPSLGELLMVPLYAIYPPLARLVPLLGYAGLGAAGGELARRLDGGRSGLSPASIFLAGFAWTLALRPAALQSNALMNDNLAAGFLLGALAFALRGRAAVAGLLAGCALGTRYSVWGSAAFLPLVIFLSVPRGKKIRALASFCAIAILGALPFMVRNFVVNGGRPFFPVDAPEVMGQWGVDQYGRGNDFVSFMLLPYDLLYTNTFVRGFFDYTLGKLIYVQLFALLVALLYGRILKLPRRSEPWVVPVMVSAFGLIHTVVWFRSSQQLRFLMPSLVLVNMTMLVVIARKGGAHLLALITLTGILSVVSVQKDSIRIAFGAQDSPFSLNAKHAAECFSRAGVGDEPVGYLHRDGMLGFFNQDFFYLHGHPYALPGDAEKTVNWIFEDAEPRMGFVPWPEKDPCLLKRI